MSWTKEQFERFCWNAGVDPEAGLRCPDTPKPTKAKLDGIAVARAVLRKQRERNQENENRAGTGLHGANTPGDKEMALQKEAGRIKGSGKESSQCYNIEIIGYRVRPGSKGNFSAGCKFIMEALRASGFDAWSVKYTQIRVKSYPRERTSIIITNQK